MQRISMQMNMWKRIMSCIFKVFLLHIKGDLFVTDRAGLMKSHCVFLDDGGFQPEPRVFDIICIENHSIDTKFCNLIIAKARGWIFEFITS